MSLNELRTMKLSLTNLCLDLHKKACWHSSSFGLVFCKLFVVASLQILFWVFINVKGSIIPTIVNKTSYNTDQ